MIIHLYNKTLIKPKTIFLVILVILMSSCLMKNINKSNSDYIKHKEDCVPNEEAAIKIAEAIWYPIYGESIYEKKPYEITQKNGIWIVRGTIQRPKITDTTITITCGGVPYIEIRKADCKILKICHGK
jgi:hypothetical protein